MAHNEKRTEPRVRPARRPAVALARSALALSLIAASCGTAHAEEPLRVEFVTVERTQTSATFDTTGEVIARDPITAAFSEGGRVTDVLYDVGDHVAKGTVLARIDNTQQSESLNAARASLDAANATLTQAKADEARQDRLLERGFATRAARDDALQALRAAESAVVRAEAEVERAQSDLDDTVLEAPLDATITDRQAEPGLVISPAQAAFTLAPQGRRDALFNVPDALYAEKPAELDIDMHLLETPDHKLKGRVREISPLVSEETGAVAVTVTILDPPSTMQIGEPIRGQIKLPSSSVISLPWTALTATQDGPAVWVVGDGGTVALRNIEVDRFATLRFTISSGLEVGETVVGEGAAFLYPNRPVIDVRATSGDRPTAAPGDAPTEPDDPAAGSGEAAQ